MQVSKQIDQLIMSLKNLKPELSEDKSSNSVKFSSLLRQSLGNLSVDDKNSRALDPTPNHQISSEIPPWVDPNYGYDPENPRKPNMRELMEALTGKSVETLYEEQDENYDSIRYNASEILYGVVGLNLDTRNWPVIMESEDILATARSETGIMYGTKVDIESIFDDNGTLRQQIAVLQDKSNNTLRQIPTNIALAEKTLKNFGATKSSIRANLDDKVVHGKIEQNLLSFLQNYNENPDKLGQVALQTATENISRKLSEEIPTEELEKL